MEGKVFFNSMTKKKMKKREEKKEGREIKKTKQVPNFQVSFSFLVLSSKQIKVKASGYAFTACTNST